MCCLLKKLNKSFFTITEYCDFFNIPKTNARYYLNMFTDKDYLLKGKPEKPNLEPLNYYLTDIGKKIGDELSLRYPNIVNKITNDILLNK